jgi:fructose-specific phosphotransferase system IIC component
MAEQETTSIPALIRSVVDDARQLIREEIALAKAEIREEASAVQSVGIAFGSAALLAMIGVVLLCIALGGAIAYLFNAPPWVGHGVLAILLGGGAYFLFNRGRASLAKIRALPTTTESLRENIAWIRSKSSSR